MVEPHDMDPKGLSWRAGVIGDDGERADTALAEAGVTRGEWGLRLCCTG